MAYVYVCQRTEPSQGQQQQGHTSWGSSRAAGRVSVPVCQLLRVGRPNESRPPQYYTKALGLDPGRRKP
jgi:hypothetical protein